MAIRGVRPTALSCLFILLSCLFIPSGCSSLPPSAPPADTALPGGAQPATVTYVHDGDTLYLSLDGQSELKVRLIGVDTPELQDECYAEEARELLRDLLPEGTEVWALEDEDPLDRYGRSLLYVFTDDGQLVNLSLVSLGAGTAIRVGNNDRYWTALEAAEQDARGAELGMWGTCPA